MKILTAILLCLISTIANASNFTELKTPKSKYLVKAPKVTIALPSSYEKEPTKKYPVFYVLDGDLNGHLVDAMLRRLHLSSGSNEHIIISITSSNASEILHRQSIQIPEGLLAKVEVAIYF